MKTRIRKTGKRHTHTLKNTVLKKKKMFTKKCKQQKKENNRGRNERQTNKQTNKEILKKGMKR